MPFTDDEKRQALEYAANGADFFFMPTPELREKVVQGHPMTVGIVDPLNTFIMQGKLLKLETSMVQKYCLGSLDAKNTWVFDQGHIKVVPPRLKVK